MTDWLIPTALILLVALLLLGLRQFRRITIYEFQRGLKYRAGRFQAVLPPGQYWAFRPSAHIDIIDVRRAFLTVAGQELLTRDGTTLKVSLSAEYEIADPFAARHQSADFAAAGYLQLQLALRETLCGQNLEQLLQERSTLGEQVAAICRPQFEALGLRLHAVSVKDLMLPTDLKKAYADVVKAQKEGQAALERARLETAALRSLANAARLVEEQPALLQLRWLQALGQSSGHTVVIGGDGPAVPGRAKRPKDQQRSGESSE